MDRRQTLNAYIDKCFISAILCDYHYQFYYKINMIAMLPLIIGSSLLTVLNAATIREDIMKIINILINGLNTIVIALSTQYKINDRITTYKSLYNKYQKLSHKIESVINNSEDITDKTLDEIINEYDLIQNDNYYTYLHRYKSKIIKAYSGKKSMPNSLQLDSDLVLLNS